jgi:site-specific DNA-methyltransferase (adenine-specific)
MNYLFNADCASLMESMPANYVDLTVTSPPYDLFDGEKTYPRKMRSYNGYQWDFKATANGLWRVTKEGGVAVWVVGDFTSKYNESLTPFRQALYFQDIGFNVETMIFKKSALASRGSNLLYTQIFEFMFVLSKGKMKTVNLIKDVKNSQAGKLIRRTKWHDDGLKRETATKVKEYRKRDNIWEYPVGNDNFQKPATSKTVLHPAVFPIDLARDHIRSWSNEGDVIFDPFAGSGTVGIAAAELNRRWILCDISIEYCQGIAATLGCDILNIDNCPTFC